MRKYHRIIMGNTNINVVASLRAYLFCRRQSSVMEGRITQLTKLARDQQSFSKWPREVYYPPHAQKNGICIQTLQSTPLATEWGRIAATIHPWDKSQQTSKHAAIVCGVPRCWSLPETNKALPNGQARSTFPPYAQKN